MNESERPFFPDIFVEKMRKCDGIEDPEKRRDCKITILEDAVMKIGENQKPVSWWLEVIGEGTKPLFNEIKEEMGVKFNSLDVRLGKMRSEMVTKDDLKGVKDDLKDDIKKLDERLKDDIKKLDDGIGAISAHLGVGEEKDERD